MSKEDDPKRARLYKRMVDKYASKYGYKFVKSTNASENRVNHIYKKK